MGNSIQKNQLQERKKVIITSFSRVYMIISPLHSPQGKFPPLEIVVIWNMVAAVGVYVWLENHEELPIVWSYPRLYSLFSNFLIDF